MSARKYERAVSYEKKENSQKMGQSDERRARFKRSEPYVVCDEISFTIDKSAQATDVGV